MSELWPRFAYSALFGYKLMRSGNEVEETAWLDVEKRIRAWLPCGCIS